MPRVGLPAPNILDRYVSLRFVRALSLTFVGLLGIIYIATFVDLSDKLFKGQASTRMLLAYFWYATPQFTYYALPLAVLIGTLVTIGLLTKTSELTVMKACGISLYRAAAPLLAVALLASGLLFGLQETILAAANQRADAIGRTIRGRPPRATFNPANPNWLVGQKGTIYHYTLYDPDHRQLIGLSAYEFDRTGHQLARETTIDRADYRGGRWVAAKGWTRTYHGPGSKLASETERFTDRQVALEAPDYFETERQSAEMMTFRQLSHYVDELRMSGFNVVRYRVDLQRKVAFPFVALIMGLLAVPFAVTTGRRGALFGIGLGIVLAMAYWLLTSLFAAIGTAGLLTPALAAWAPNLLFGAGAIYLILTVRT
jgi:LPS export ABC transporter permease LptG